MIQSVLPMSVREREAPQGVDRALKADSATDRDANGQSAPKKDGSDRPPMTDEEFEKALLHLKALAVVKEHSWSIESLVANEKRFVLIKDHLGKIIRRIPEQELWSLVQTTNSKKGQLLRKSA